MTGERNLRKWGLTLVDMYTGQAPEKEGIPVFGEKASEVLAAKFEVIIGWSGLSTSDMRLTLEKAKGNHKEEALRALDILEERKKGEEE